MAKNKWLRVVCLMLSVVMALSCMAAGVSAEETYAASVGTAQYKTVAEAVANANGQVVKLLTDSREQVTVTGDLYLDLNGHTLTEVTVAEGVLYGMDSTTDDYDCSDGYGKILSLTGNYEPYHKTEITGAIRRYLAVEENGAVSFHRFYVGITYASMRPSNKGVGYKAVFAGDSMVKSKLDETEAFGYTLKLDGHTPVSVWKPVSEFVSLKTVTLLLENFDAAQYGETDLFATVQIKLAGGSVISAASYNCTMRQIMETVNNTYTSYTDKQITSLADWINEVPVMLQWRTENIVPRQNVTPTGLTVRAQSVEVDKGTGEVTVDVLVFNNPGIMTATITVEVDDDVLGFKRASKTEFPGLFLTSPGSKQKESPYNFLLDGMELTDEDKVDGTLFTITFTIKDLEATGTYDVVLSYVEGDITDEYYEPLEVNLENGKITIK